MNEPKDTTKNTHNPDAGKFSFYPDTVGTDGRHYMGVGQHFPVTTTCSELYRFITKQTPLPELAERTANLQQAIQEHGYNSEQVQTIKRTLPTFRATGIFAYSTKTSPRHQIQSSSNLICIDFDNVADIQTAWQRLINDAVLPPVLLFHSARGNGLKCIVPFPEYKDKNKWKYCCKAIDEHYKDIISTDEATGETRPALDFDNANTLQHTNSICIDESAYYNPKADAANADHDKALFAAAITYTEKRAAEIETAEPKPQPRTVTHADLTPSRPNGRTYTAEEMAEYTLKVATWYANQLQAANKDITKGIFNWHAIGFALSDSVLPYAEAEAIFCKVSAQYPNYNEKECKTHFKRCSNDRDGSKSIASFFKMAAEALGETYEEHHRRQRPPTQSTMATLTTQATIDKDTAATIPAPIQETITTQQTMDTTATQTFKQTTLHDIEAEAAKAAPSIPTAYTFNDKPLTLRSSAITLIAAKSSHGKTRLLENMAYYTATQDNTQEGATILFTLEEPKKSVFAHLTGIHAYKNGKQYDITELENTMHQHGKGEEADREQIKALQSFDAILTKCNLFIFSDTDKPQSNDKWSYNTVQAICEDMRLFAKQQRIKAIYIDHLQMLNYNGEGATVAKAERIEHILTALEQLAKDLHAPVIITAQMNRSTYNGLDMDGGNIAESADTERSADTILLLWNSTYPFKNSRGETSGGESEFTNIGYHYTGQSKEQILLANLYKRRGGERGAHAAFAYHAPFGSIEQLPKPQETITAEAKRQQLKETIEKGKQGKL